MKGKTPPKPAALPAPPSADSLFEAQTGAAKDVAQTQFDMNAVNQTTPFGSLTYNQIGKNPDGTPRYEAVTDLSPQEGAALNRDYTYRAGIDNAAIGQTGRVNKMLASPFKLGNEATEARLMELGSARLTPELDRRRAALETQLYNQGVRPGTEAFREAMAEFGRQENDAYNQLLLTGRQQAANESLTERQQPLSELTTLSGLRQGINYPSFVNTPQVSLDTPNLAEFMMSEYELGPLANTNAMNQWRMQKFQADEANRQAMLGGIFGLAAAPLGGWASGGFKNPFG